MDNARIMIASPTPGTVKTAYMKSVISTMLDLGNRGITCEFVTEEGSSPELQRNLLATRFLETQCTHLFFVDSDMMFEADLCARMLAAGKPFIGAVCSTRNLDRSRIERALARGASFNDASLFGVNWLFYMRDGETQIAVDNGILEVDAVGFGIVLIHRSVFETMARDKAVEPQAKTNEQVGGFYNFFASFIPGQYISEDISFCKRWRSHGGHVWAFADASIYHTGDFGYGGSYFAFLEAANRQR
jgi:hypothetical protein